MTINFNPDNRRYSVGDLTHLQLWEVIRAASKAPELRIMKRRNYEIKAWELGRETPICPAYSGMATPEEVAVFFGLNQPDITRYEIWEVFSDGSKKRVA